MAEDLYERPELYDLVSPPDPDMERFYVEAAGGSGRQVLELACGTGRLTLPLLRSGADVTGGDLSPAMLDAARQRASMEGLAPNLVPLDMRDFALGRRFDTIIVAANSLLHLTQAADQLAFLASAARHLKPDGRLIFDIFVPSAWILSRPGDERQLLGLFAHPELGEVRIEETIAYDPIAQISHIDWYWSHPAEQDFRHTRLAMRQIYPQELLLLLERGGFAVIERFGGFDHSPLTPTSMRQVVICAVR
ncbi:class I SAM-dependent methyltransferase [Devosia neptuniae]|uniref:Class I SAM-dependent methyltransferase n=1 Tax=Devosia neptuniae TaxID=191302 RepID=A0ABY6CJ39_9HYPH|nr:class I SAM-dependent methyltransferase [Devosia neptuniae]UXN71352.1 class I SAM-dependent methyltransferase [Devosia neptuniae]